LHFFIEIHQQYPLLAEKADMIFSENVVMNKK